MANKWITVFAFMQIETSILILHKNFLMYSVKNERLFYSNLNTTCLLSDFATESNLVIKMTSDCFEGEWSARYKGMLTVNFRNIVRGERSFTNAITS